MITCFQFIAHWIRARSGEHDRGASLVEYALLVALVAAVCIAAVTLLGQSSSSKLEEIGSSIN
jgi:pilus assembly protein Flp/PilA